MSKRLDVLKAVKALVQAALPSAQVIGLDGEEAAPDRIPPTGRVIVRSGDPGGPEVDLSPLTYNYSHPIPVEIAAYESGSLASEEVLDDMMGRIGAGLAADRTLGGLCDWIEADAPLTDDIYASGARPPRSADLVITAAYSTPDPLN